MIEPLAVDYEEDDISSYPYDCVNMYGDKQCLHSNKKCKAVLGYSCGEYDGLND
jgi:hypothetical protein